MKNKFNGIKFKKIRERYGLTQLELADKVNEKYGKAVVDASSISRWEINPNAVPRNNKLVKVAETLGVSVDIFFDTDKKDENYERVIDNEKMNNTFASELIPSKDVRKYLAEQGREFSDFEKATLIYNHPGLDLSGKEQALKELAKSTQDERLMRQINERIEKNKRYLEAFINHRDGFIYVLVDNQELNEGYFASYIIAKKYGLESHAPFSVKKVRLVSEEKQSAPLHDENSECSAEEYPCGEVCHDEGGNIKRFWDVELDESPVRSFTPEDRARFELSYMDIPYPFRTGDIVRVIGSDKIGVVMGPRSETEYQDWREKFNKMKTDGSIDYRDCAVTVDFIDDTGKFSHSHPMPIWLEYAELSDDNPRKEALECARDLLIGNGSFESFQRACEEMREKLKE